MTRAEAKAIAKKAVMTEDQLKKDEWIDKIVDQQHRLLEWWLKRKAKAIRRGRYGRKWVRRSVWIMKHQPPFPVMKIRFTAKFTV